MAFTRTLDLSSLAGRESIPPRSDLNSVRGFITIEVVVRTMWRTLIRDINGETQDIASGQETETNRTIEIPIKYLSQPADLDSIRQILLRDLLSMELEKLVPQLLSFVRDNRCLHSRALVHVSYDRFVSEAMQSELDRLHLAVTEMYEIAAQLNESSLNLRRANEVLREKRALAAAAEEDDELIEEDLEFDCDACNGGEVGTCSVCLEDLYGKLTRMPNCSHIYHKSCILSWLEKNNSCPVCRTIIID